MTVADQLSRLAYQEKAIASVAPTCAPEFVDRAYHVGRESAFADAARLVAADELLRRATGDDPDKPEGELR